jgi:hypothetical protein
MKINREEASVSVNDSTVVIRRRGVSLVEVAGVLDLRRDANGNPDRVFLDRRVHGAGTTHIGDWYVVGAFCTVMERDAGQNPPKERDPQHP